MMTKAILANTLDNALQFLRTGQSGFCFSFTQTFRRVHSAICGGDGRLRSFSGRYLSVIFATNASCSISRQIPLSPSCSTLTGPTRHHCLKVSPENSSASPPLALPPLPSVPAPAVAFSPLPSPLSLCSRRAQVAATKPRQRAGNDPTTAAHNDGISWDLAAPRLSNKSLITWLTPRPCTL